MPIRSAPLEPTEEQARQWLVEELSRAEYQEARPGLFQRLLEWLGGLIDLDEVPSAGEGLGTALLLLAVVVVVAVVLRVVGPVRSARRRSTGAVFDEVGAVSADEHRRRADAHAEDGRWEEAVRERFRALVRGLEERAVLDERPGRTADEAAVLAGESLPALADRLSGAATTFDDVCYGGRTATTDQHESLRDLDTAIGAARPVRRTASGEPVLVAPR